MTEHVGWLLLLTRGRYTELFELSGAAHEARLREATKMLHNIWEYDGWFDEEDCAVQIIYVDPHMSSSFDVVAAYKDFVAADTRRRAKEDEQRDRTTYERLKLKFEGPTT